MKRLALVAAALAAACATAPVQDAASLAGRYQLVEINGTAVPAPSPTEASVTMQGGTLRLEDGRYWLELSAATNDTPSGRSHALNGTFTVTEDALAFTPAADSEGDPVTFRVAGRGRLLTLRDPMGHSWTFRRQ